MFPHRESIVVTELPIGRPPARKAPAAGLFDRYVCAWKRLNRLGPLYLCIWSGLAVRISDRTTATVPRGWRALSTIGATPGVTLGANHGATNEG
jgi:hypothetical protein